MATSFLEQIGVRSWVDLSRRRAGETPERVAYTWLDGGREVDRLTYRELDRRARALAATLAETAPPGERALLLFPPGLDFIVAFLGCLYAGVVAVPAYPPRRNRGMERLDAIVADTRPRWVLTTERLASRIGSWMEDSGLTGPAAPRVLATDGVDAEAAEAWREPGLGPDALAFLQYTSGSTSTPKGVRVAHGHLLHNEEMIRRAFGQSPDSVIVSWLPLYHDMGLIGGVLQPLYLGARCILMSPFGFLQNPRSWLEAVTTYRATTSGGPDFGYGLCVRKIAPEAREGLDLSSWSVAFNGSEPVRPETLRAFTEAFAPHGFRPGAHYPCYGLAEATLFVTGGTVDEAPPLREVSSSALERHRVEAAADDGDRRRLVGCGRVWDGQALAVVDPETRRRLPEGRVGEIWISGPSVAGGYWNRPEQTEEEFQASIAGDDDGRSWLRTGDLGFQDGSELYVTGRLKDLIILRGRNYYPHDFERTADGVHEALRPGCGAAFSIEAAGEERLVAVQEVDRRFAARQEPETLAEMAEAVRRAVAEEHQVAVYEVVLVDAGQVPKTSSGKVRRSRCRERYQDDDLQVLARTGPAEVERHQATPRPTSEAASGAAETGAGLGLDRGDLEFLDDDERLPILKLHLRRAVARAVGLPAEAVDAKTPLTALGLDSLASMELVHAVEASLRVELPLADLLEGPTLAELARGLLERLDEPPRSAAPTPTPGRDARATGTFPLSYGQRALWFLHRLAPDSSAYHIAAAFHVASGFETRAFEEACRALVRRHPALRTTFHAPADLAGEPTQRVHGEGSLDLEAKDAPAGSEDRRRQALADEVARPFDLESGPLFRIRLWTDEDGGATVLVVVHHIVADFWSMGILARDLDRLLRPEAEALPPPGASHVELVSTERDRLGGPEGERLWRFWEDRLAGATAELELPTDRPRPRVQTHAGAAWRRTLPAELASGLGSLARRRGATPFVTLLAVFSAALHRLTGQGDLTVGSPVAGRDDHRFAGTVGYFVNPVALRSEATGDLAFAAHLDATRRRVTEALEHAGLPLPLLAERLRPERDASRSPLFQALFVHHRAAMAGEEALASLAVGRDGVTFRLGELEAESRSVPEQAAQFDLTLAVAQVGEDLHATLTYNTDLFDATTARRLLGTVETLARGAVADPHRTLSALPLQTAAEEAQILSEFSTVAAVPRDPRSPVRRVADQALATPEAPALVVGTRRWTYRRLMERAGRVAETLRARGLTPEERVGLLLPRTGDLVAAILGIWGAGGAYVPVDPTYPEERRQLMLEDSGARFVVTDADHAGEPAVTGPDRTPILVDDLPDSSSGEGPPEGSWVGPRLGPRHLAYVIYTSGSTGRPKGVAIDDGNAGALLDWARTAFSARELRGVLAATSVCFDLSVFELLLPLTTGGTVILADHAVALGELPARDRVTLVNTVPSALAELLEANALPASVETVNLAGEVLQGALAAKIYATGTVERVYNLYGPSEDTTYSTASRVPRAVAHGAEPTIGRPVAGTRAYVLDGAGRGLPLGVAGELCLGGAGLARGYLGRPAHTARRWVPDPFGPVRGPAAPGSRLYRTGDRARWLPSGELEFLGRFDHQIKLRGFRIELGEIETALTALPRVAEAVAGVRDGALAAFVVPAEAPEDPGAFFQGLRRDLASRLPSYMVPAVGAVLDEMPRTPNGKVDRRALARVSLTGSEGDAGGLAPRTDTERVLAQLWARVLDLDRSSVGVDEDVFALGAHSLMATRVASRLPRELGVEIPLSAFFEAPTVAEQAARVEARRGSETAPESQLPPLVPVSRDRELPLSYAQERLWFLERLEPGAAVYHVAEALDLEGHLSAPALAAALDGLVRRHEALRTVFPERDGEPRQEVRPPRAVPRPILDLSRLTPGDRQRTLIHLAPRAARRPFDLLGGPLFRAVLVRRGPRRHGLWVQMHHVITDGWSLGILARELTTLYAAARAGEPPAHPEPTLHYADYAVWQRRVLTPEVLERRLDAWRQRLAGAPPVLELPTDRPRPQEASPDGGRVELAVAPETTARLDALAARHEGTRFMALGTAWGALLGRLSRQSDLVIGTPVAHRTRPELEDIPGFFVNTLALRLNLAGRPTFRRLLARARRTALDAFEHQDLPFEVLVQELAPERSLAASPLFQAFFVLQNAPLEPLELEDLTLTRRPVDPGTAHFDLSLELTGGDGGLEGFLEFRRDLLDRSTVERWSRHLVTLLEAAGERPETPWTELPLLTPTERGQLVREYNATARPEPGGRVDGRFDAVARESPDALAVEHAGSFLSYGALDRLSAALARKLVERGVGPDRPVGVCLPRGLEQVVAVLAVLRAGGACLPLDPSYPAERLELMVADARPAVLLTHPTLEERVERLAESDSTRVLPVALPPEEGMASAGGPLPGERLPASLAYVIYTSGSTGVPKGVALPHRALVNLMAWQDRHLAVPRGGRTLQFAPMSFDVFFQELFSTWGTGGTLVLVGDEVRRDPEALWRLLGERRVQRLFVPFVALSQLAETARESAREGMETPETSALAEIATAGEQLQSTPAVRELFRRSGARLANQYGPSEAHVVSATTLEADPAGWPPLPGIGGPIDNVRLYVVDSGFEPAPLGVPGELLIGGACLARGYHGRPARTAAAFVPDPFGPESAEPGGRLYRTGDLARWDAHGELEFLGRRDHQVKIRGHRVEPGEVETVLAEHRQVREAVVAVRGDGPADRRLVAWVVSDLDAGEPLRRYLEERLPPYMVPGSIAVLESFPLTPSGKVDRRSLPDPEPVERQGFEPPATPAEELVAGVFRELLGASRVGRRDSFFDLGGHSLMAARAVSRLRRRFGVDLSVRDLFRVPGVRDLARHLDELAAGDARLGVPPLEPASRRGPLPASYAQERLWFLDRLEPGSSLYNMSGAYRLRGSLAAASLAQAFSAVATRHESLRTRLVERDGAPVQEIDPPGVRPLPMADLSGLDAGDRQRELAAAADREARRPFELARGPLWRARLVRSAGDDHGLFVSMHHVISDGWSLGILIRELGSIYAAASAGAPAALPEPAVQYADFALWQRRWLSGDVLDRALTAWEERLGGLEPLALPADRPPRAGHGRPAADLPVTLSAELTRRLGELAERSGATPFMVLLAGLEAILGRYTGRRDLAVGTPVAGRTTEETEGLIGFFVNTLALRADLGGRPGFVELVARAREQVVGAFVRQDVPFAKVVERLRPARAGEAEDPLVQVMLALQNAPAATPDLPGLAVKRLPVASPGAKFHLTLELEETDGPAGPILAGRATYRRDLFDATTVERLLRHFQALLEAAVATPEAPVADLEILSDAELRQLLVEPHAPGIGDSETTVPARFLEVARARAAETALVWDAGSMTYGALAAAASREARRLRRHGVGPETAVGLTVKRSPDFVVAALAVTLAGGAYVPLDLSYPGERLAAMAEDAGVGIVLTRGALPAELEASNPRVLELDPLPAGTAETPGSLDPVPPPAPTPDSLAYVMFTSGSTGRPKGVAVCHRSIVRLVRGADYARLGPEETLLLLAPVSFDASTLEMWGALLHGGRLAVPPAGPLGLPELGEQIQAHGVSTLWLTAGLFHRMVDENLPGLAGLGQLLAGGDVLSPEHVGRVLEELPGTVVVNGYGPTENTTFTCCHSMKRPEDLGGELAGVPLGTPIHGTRVYVLDDELHPVPLGVWGELYAGGDGLARGYVRRPRDTASAFLPAPPELTSAGAEDAGARLYATGDLARWSPRGWMEFAGRADTQVKVRGFRIELGEIETALIEHPRVRDAVVTASKDGRGDDRLVAYVVLDGDAGAGDGASEDLDRTLRRRLPAYMVPSFFVELPELPLNPNGKVDRQALPAPEIHRDAQRTAPRTDTEAVLAELFAEVLEVPRVGVGESFFELGGHSLLATRLVSRIRGRFGVELPLRRVFEEPTVEGLGRILDDPSKAQDEPLVPVPRDGDPPLSFAQERLYILDRLEPGNAAYNLPAALRLAGALAGAALDQALGEVVRRHEALRTTFEPRDGRPVQVIHPESRAAQHGTVAQVDLTALEPAARRRQAEVLFARETERPFDLARGPLVRFYRLRLDETEHVLILDLHHIVTDGWSMGVLLDEMAPLYGAFRDGEPSPLAELPLQHADFCLWQRRRLSGERLETQLAYWRRALEGAPPGLELPTDRPRPAVRTYRGAWSRGRLDPKTTTILRSLSERHGASLFMTLLAAFTLLASRWSGQDDVLVGSPVAGRQRGEIEGLIGFFLNTLVLRTDLTGEPTFEELLGRVRETALEAYAHQELPFEKLLDELGVERDLSRTPLFSVFFNMVNVPFGDVELPGLELEPLRSPELPSKFDLTLYVREADRGLTFDLAYNAQLFTAPRIEALMDAYRFLLEQVAADPTRRASAYSLVSPDQASRLPDPEASLDDGWPGSVQDLFVERARRTPDAHAVCDPSGAWTYGDLDRASARWARELADAGVRSQDPVAIWAHRSAVLVPAVLGTLRAGGAFVMLDPAYPPRRLARMLELARPRAFLHLTAAGELPAELADHLAGAAGCPVLELPPWPQWTIDADEAPRAPDPPVAPDDLAYVSFTSGSTGVPKGILGRHGPLTHFLPWQAERFGLGPGDRYSLLSGLAHDPLQRDVFTALCLGGTVVVPDPAEIFAAGRLAAWMVRERVTVAHLTPAMGQVLAETGPDGPVTVESLRWVLLVGDALTRRDVARLERLAPRVRCVNLYGSTETQRAVGHHVIERGGAGEDKEILPLGRGMPDVQLLVLNGAGDRAGIGELGEIAVRSPHLARGYLDDPELTDRRFVTNPWSDDPGDRLYRTGDLGRYRPDGEVAFAGRADTQVQVRGFRIELSEIEGELGRLEGVREAVVQARGQAADRRLVAFVVPEPGSRPAIGDLRRALAERLPAYMVPTGFALLEALPLTPNGKVDRRALAARDDLSLEVESMHRDPETDTERLIARLIAEALEVERIGVDDNFFDLGANSLLLVQVHGRLEEALERKIPAVDLFSHPTVRELAGHLTARSETAGGSRKAQDGKGVETTEDAPDRSERLKAGRARLAARRKRRK